MNIALQTDDDLNAVFDDFARRAAAEGVSYAEFTIGLDPQDVPFVEATARRIEAQTGVVVRFNSSFNRLQSQAVLLAQAKAILPVRSFALVGIDLLADESHAPALETGQAEYATILQAVNEGTSMLHRTMHAGELGDTRNPRDAIILGAERLGHGVKLIQDPVTLEYAATRKIAVEVNLVSNLRLQAIENLKNHPLLKYLRLGLPVSLSTDDEGILETDINKECAAAVTNSDVTYFELKQMAFNSIQTSFADETAKDGLLTQLRESFGRFENQYHLPVLY